MHSLLLLILLGTFFTGRSYSTEPWSDERLPVKDGVALWFDCSRQYAGRGALKMPPLFSGNQTDYLIDGSGRGRHLAQPVTDARPTFHQEFNGAYLSFDGVKRALYAFNLHERFTNVTIYVVANVRANKGNFPSLFSLAGMGENDYRSGLNLDLGPSATRQFSTINLEGSGMAGMTNLLKRPLGSFDEWHIFSLDSKQGTNGSRLYVDGFSHKPREREPSEINLGAFVLGARIFSNGGPPPFLQGFFTGDIAEFLLYNRALDAREKTGVETYLKRKYGALLERGPGFSQGSKRLFSVTNAPPVQMFAPGFTVRPLPLTLPNINNLKYRSDGKLVALGYNGHIYLLSSKNGSVVENQSEPFWTNNSLRAPIGMALTPPGYARGQGVFVAAKGKLSLVIDTNGDDRADSEIIVADGWKELSHGVDALGVALDKAGNIYFGLGAANFTDPYLIDKATGDSNYSLKSERGTILKVSPDFKHREIVCTGVRFSVALAFNQLGDLFCTDQEGATWLSNGNPFDELLHIQPGRHYGFPPNHPRYLPNVIDEPSVYDYGPQHQSTCGLNFNNSVNGGPVFGPAWWADNAIVSGYSRGKIWRTELVKTAAGYVARARQIASLDTLTVDACVSPQGDLVVSTHSGEPDWGSGPNGYGHLYKISYTDSSTPQPTIVWHNSQSEIHVAFDRPLEPEALKNLAQRIELTQGKYVSAGDRFEILHPGYAAVVSQFSESRYDVKVESTALTADHRTLILNTKPHAAGVNYSISLAGWTKPLSPVSDVSPQRPDMELMTDLAGIQVDWTPEADSGSTQAWHGWLPHVDLEVARRFTDGSAEHQQFWANLQKPGQLELGGQLDLWDMLQPSIQPGSKLDYDRPHEEVIVAFSAGLPFKIQFQKSTLNSEATPEGRQQILLRHRSQEAWLPFQLSIPTGKKPLALTAVWSTTADSRPRPFPLRRFLLPWAEPDGSTDHSQQISAPEIAGGDWLEGRNIFFSPAVNCQRCHTIRAEGQHVGPDLSNLIYRDYASVMKDIQQPSAAINPDFVAYNVEPKDGESLLALLQTETRDEITFVDGTGHSSTLRKDGVKSLKPSPISFMPEGLLTNLTAKQIKDLMTFLLTTPLQPASLEIGGVPSPRKEPEIKQLLQQTALPKGTNASRVSPFRIVLCAGPKDHGPSEHDYPLWQKRWRTLLALKTGASVSTAWEWPTDEQLETANVIIFYSNNPGWNEKRAERLQAYLDRGGGAVFVHFAIDGHDKSDLLAQILGAAWQGGASKFRHGPLKLKLEASPISHGITSVEFNDESYWDLKGRFEGAQVIASSVEEGEARPQIWLKPHGKGRVFVCIPGHYTWTFDDPLYRVLLLRGIAWAAGEPCDSLLELACIGSRISN